MKNEPKAPRRYWGTPFMPDDVERRGWHVGATPKDEDLHTLDLVGRDEYDAVEATLARATAERDAWRKSAEHRERMLTSAVKAKARVTVERALLSDAHTVTLHTLADVGKENARLREALEQIREGAEEASLEVRGEGWIVRLAHKALKEEKTDGEPREPECALCGELGHTAQECSGV